MKKRLLLYCKEQKDKKKTGNIRVTYKELLFQAAGQDEQRVLEIQTEQLKEFQQLLSELTQEHILKGIKASRKSGFVEAVYEKYEIVGNPKKIETNTEFITLLHSYIGTNVFEAYRYEKEEFEKDKEAIDVLYQYYKSPKKQRLTSNELGYYLFEDEKAFEQPEDEKKKNRKKEKVGKYSHLLKKMGLEMERDLHACYTKEPFFCQMRKSFFEKDVRDILIVENKDSYFRLKNHEITKDYDCVIFGEGWKITSSFSMAEENGIMITDRIDYFGDMDPEGFLIYQNLKERYPEYEIRLQFEFYKRTIEATKGRALRQIKSTVTDDVLRKALEVLNEFDADTASYLKNCMVQGYYIPQEAIVLSLLALS